MINKWVVQRDRDGETPGEREFQSLEEARKEGRRLKVESPNSEVIIRRGRFPSGKVKDDLFWEDFETIQP